MHIVHHGGAKERPTDRRYDGIFGANHLAIETQQTTATPDRMSLFVLADVPSGTLLHAKTTCRALLSIHPKQPAVHLSDQPTVQEKSLQTINDCQCRVVFPH